MPLGFRRFYGGLCGFAIGLSDNRCVERAIAQRATRFHYVLFPYRAVQRLVRLLLHLGGMQRAEPISPSQHGAAIARRLSARDATVDVQSCELHVIDQSVPITAPSFGRGTLVFATLTILAILLATGAMVTRTSKKAVRTEQALVVKPALQAAAPSSAPQLAVPAEPAQAEQETTPPAKAKVRTRSAQAKRDRVRASASTRARSAANAGIAAKGRPPVR